MEGAMESLGVWLTWLWSHARVCLTRQQNAFVEPKQCALRPLVPLYWITFWTSGDLSLGHVLALCWSGENKTLELAGFPRECWYN